MFAQGTTYAARGGRMMKKVLFLVLVIALSGSLVACKRHGTKYTMNIGSAVSATNPTTIALKSFKKAVEKRTKGDVTINIHTDSALGNEGEMLEQVIGGTLEAAMEMGAANWESYNAEADVALLPFLWTDIEAARTAWNGDFGARFISDIIEPSGCKVLSIWESGFRHMTNNVRPVITPKDILGIKFRTNNNDMKVQMFKALNGSVVMMAFSEVFTSLQNGTIDGQENPLANIYTSSIHEVQKYLSLTGHMYDAAPLVCNPEWFNSLPEDYQNILMEEAANAREVDLKENDESKFLSLLKKSDIKVNEVDRDAFQKKVRIVWDNFAAKYGQDWIDLAQSQNKM
jgi:tripartite ATP-independent transporter DctP family solute receptor